MQNQEETIRQLPYSIESERSVLGAMLQDAGSVSLAMEMMNDKDFYLGEHQKIFECMKDLQLLGMPIDIRTVSEELKKRNYLNIIGGEIYLVSLIEYVPVTVNVKYYIQIVLDKSTLRQLINGSNDISKMCYAQEEDISQILSKSEKIIYDIVMKKYSDSNLKHITEILKETFNHIALLSNLNGKLYGVPTGFYDLDRMLTGLHGGEFVLVGARPSMGKTSVAVSIAKYASMSGNKSTAIFSLEMPIVQIGMRLICSDAGVNMQRVRDGSLSDIEFEKIANSLSKLSKSPMYIDDTAAISTTQLRSRCRRLKMEKGLDLIVLDYLQLMQTDKRSENRQNEVSEISRQLKAIAMELNVPLIACSQLSRRAAKAGENNRPVLSDLRESGAIEQDADVVIFVHRENYYRKKDNEEMSDDIQINDNEGELIVAKQRNGPIGTVLVEWQPEFVRYANKPGTKVAEFKQGE